MEVFELCCGNGRKVKLDNFDSEEVSRNSQLYNKYIDGISYKFPDECCDERGILDDVYIEHYILPNNESHYIVAVCGVEKQCNEEQMHDTLLDFLNWTMNEEYAEEKDLITS